MRLALKSLKQLLLNFLHAFVVDGPSLLKENQSYQPGTHLQIGWKKRQKLVSPSSSGCPNRENGSIQILALNFLAWMENGSLHCRR